MPPNPRQRRALSYETPSLSDDGKPVLQLRLRDLRSCVANGHRVCVDVGLLYQIITRAEGRPEAEQTPFRALFAAYDEVLAEHAVDADPGHVCLHFLFKMGSKDISGDTLFDKFENLLQHMGIVIELGDDDSQTQGYYGPGSTDGFSGVVDRERIPREQNSIQQTPRRRASFNSMYDVGDDPTQRSLINRPSSRSSLSRLEIGKPDFHESSPTPRRSGTDNRHPASPNRTQLIAQFVDVGRRLLSRFDVSKANEDDNGDETQASIGVQAKSAVNRDRSERVAGAKRRRSQESLISSGSDETDDDHDDNDDSISFHDDGVSYQKQDLPAEMLYRPSLSDLLRDASTFNMYRQRAINRRILTQWMKRAAQLQQSRQSMEAVSANRDRFTLIRQAFETWRSIIRDKRQTARTERFFKHLEQRAGRARDLFLVTKAFTHWAQVTSDEVARTSAARQHVISVKYFNAWREITAVNELKSQRFTLRRPFNTWRKKVHQIRETEATAAVCHEKDLMNGVYWQWFWSFCDRRAPQWYDNRLKRRSLLSWLRKFRTNRERNHELEVRNKQLAVTTAWQAWSQRSKALANAEQEAATMQRQRLLKEMFGEWKIKSCFAPPAFRVSDKVDKRLLRTTFEQWTLRLQMAKKAREMDRYRIMQNSFTMWNDHLRCQALSARINERLKMETMYKWILAERFRLMQRIRDQRIKRDTFSTFVASIRGTYSQLLHNADVHEDYRNEELLRSKFSLWRERLMLQREREYVAFEFYAPRLQQESLVAWRSKRQNVLKLDERANDARFYFLATRTIKQWKNAAEQSTKRRRQETYAQIRRKVKINLAAKAIGRWKAWAGEVAQLEYQAVQFRRRKLLKISFELLGRWHYQASQRVQDCFGAEMYYARQAAYAQLMNWAEMSFKNRDLELQADGMRHAHVLGQAHAQLRKLSLRVFQLNSSWDTADSMRERTTRKHARGMLRNWIEQTSIKLEERDSFAPLVTPGRNFDGASSSRPDPAVFDPWYSTETPFKINDFVAQSQGPSVTSPLATPNYMASPSKRAARAKTLAQQGSTTPATPLHTPFAGRLLRAGALGNQSASTRRRNGRGSAMGNSVRFADEEPASPSEGRRSGGRRVGS